MEYRRLEVKVESAKDLKDLNLLGKMDVYAVVTLSGGQKTKTPVDRNGGTNPTWNFPVNFTLPRHHPQLTLEIKLRCERALAADKDIGEVVVPLNHLLNQPGDGISFQHVTYQVTKPSGKPKGSFHFSYKFTSPSPPQPNPLLPPNSVGSTSSSAQYPPLPPQYAYPPLPQPSYGYPPQPPPPSTNTFGMGLVGGASNWWHHI